MLISTLDDYNNLKSRSSYSFYCKNCGKLVNIARKRTDKVNKEIQKRFLCKECNAKRTCNIKYGVDCAVCLKKNRIDDKLKLTKDEFISKAREVHGNKYDYSLVNYINNETRVSIICNNKYHKGYIFEQTPHVHLAGSGCAICAGNIPMSREEYEIRAREVHGNKYDYSLVEYKRANDKIKIICPKHGIFEQVARAHIDFKQGCPFCKESHGERAIRLFLREYKIEFEAQKKFDDLRDKSKLSYDFFIPGYNTLIEFNGEQHYIKNAFKHHNLRIQRHHDWLKRKYAQKNNYKLLVIPYWEKDNINNILRKEFLNE